MGDFGMNCGVVAPMNWAANNEKRSQPLGFWRWPWDVVICNELQVDGGSGLKLDRGDGGGFGIGWRRVVCC